MAEPQLESTAIPDANCALRTEFEDCLQEVLAHQVFDGIQTEMPLGIGKNATGGGTQARLPNAHVGKLSLCRHPLALGHLQSSHVDTQPCSI